MAQTSRPWAGTVLGDCGPYNFGQWNDVWGAMSRSGVDFGLAANYNKGVFYQIGNALEPSLNAGNVDVDTGASLVDGLYHENTAVVSVPIVSPVANPRIDIIVVRKNYQQAVTYTPDAFAPTVPPRTARITVIHGAENAIPVAPALTQDTTRTTYWDIPICSIDVSALGVESNLVDLREFVDNNFGVSILAANNGVTDVIELETTVSDGNGANGLGAAIKFKLEDTAGVTEDAGQLAVVWKDATSGSEDSQLEFRLESGGSPNLSAVIVAPATASADGNARGVGAVDLQQSRTAVTQVASGLMSFACGMNNTASGAGSDVSGQDNTASGSWSHAEGYGNTASGGRSHAEGDGTAASGNYSHAEGDRTIASGNYSHAEGAITTASGSHAHAEGSGGVASGAASYVGGASALASKWGQFSRAGYSVAADGDTQYSDYHISRAVTHSDANWYQLYLDGAAAANRITVAADQVMTFDVLIVGTTQGCTKSFAFRIVGIIENDAGTTTLLASTVTTIYDGDDTDFNARASADDANDALLIEVTDSTSGGDTVRWSAVLRASEVTFPA